MKVQVLIDEVRRLIQDRDTPYRTSDDDLAALTTQYLRELFRVRPDAYVPYSTSTPLPTITAADFDTDWPVGEQFYPAATYYVAGHVELQDDEHVNSGRASGFVERAYQMLVGDR